MNATVVVPTFNKATFLALTLASLAKQTQEDFELIVVDDGSTDGTPDIIFSAAHSLPNLRYTRQNNGGRSHARNTGIALARGDILIFTEDDHIVEPDFVAQHLSSHQTGSDVVVVGGIGHQIVTHWPPDKQIDAQFARASDNPKVRERLSCRTCTPDDTWYPIVTTEDVQHDFMWVRSLAFPDGNLANKLDHVETNFGRQFQGFETPWLFFGGGNVSAPTQVIRSLGGFCEQFVGWGSEDLEMGFRLHKAGLKFELNRATRSMHQVHPRNRTTIAEQAAANHAIFLRIHPDYEVLLFCRYDNPRYSGLRTAPISIAEYNQRVVTYYRSDSAIRERMYRSLQDELQVLKSD